MMYQESSDPTGTMQVRGVEETGEESEMGSPPAYHFLGN